MNPSPSSHSQRYERIRNHPKFQELARSRARLAWSLTALVLGGYYLFMLVVAFFPKLLHTPLSAGSQLTYGIPVAAAVIVLSWLFTGWYVRVANTRFDTLSAELLEELQ